LEKPVHLALITVVSRLRDLPVQHRVRLLALIGGIAVAGTSLSYAVATLGPDPANLPTRLIVETVQPEVLAPDDDALSQLRLYRSEVTRHSDTLAALFDRLGVIDAEAKAFIMGHRELGKELLGRSGRWVNAEISGDQRLKRLTLKWMGSSTDDTFNRLELVRGESGFEIKRDTAPLEVATRMASASIRSSLFAATDEARIPDAIASQLADVFSGEIDFYRDLRKNDRFSVVYESLEADGEPVRAGKIITAEFVNKGKSHTAVWFEDPAQKKGSYYTLDGQSLKRAYLGSPLAFTRMTSGFGMRMHPISRSWKQHNGTDFGAPIGTPVRVIGDGVVTFAGVMNGYGNVVTVRHRQGGHSTLYAHLSRIDVRKGQSVSQSDIVGKVGMTGWATGPHLHFEFRVNNRPVNPLTMVRSSPSVPVSAQGRPAFRKVAQSAQTELTQAATVQSISVE
jgi:murein DD-endopeptidase MepM/ murein hydrolase activator NlpD